jgi:hypothetical protein
MKRQAACAAPSTHDHVAEACVSLISRLVTLLEMFPHLLLLRRKHTIGVVVALLVAHVAVFAIMFMLLSKQAVGVTSREGKGTLHSGGHPDRIQYFSADEKTTSKTTRAYSDAADRGASSPSSHVASAGVRKPALNH